MDLVVRELVTGYGKVEICRSISFEVPTGRMVALVGRNGAGKSTVLRAVGGWLPTWRGQIMAESRDVSQLSVPRRMKLGIAHVPQELALFPKMTVNDNLVLGSYLRSSKEANRARAFVLDTFPRLGERLRQDAGTMSGGEQRMLAIGRGLMASPRILLLDEPCTGLSPAMQEQLFGAIRTVLDEGIAILLAEQNLARTVKEANEVLVVQRGKIIARRHGARDEDGNISENYADIVAEVSQLELAEIQ